MRYRAIALLCCCTCLPACSLLGMTGLDASKSYSCKAPPGISCSSLSGVYANAVANNLPGSTTEKSTTAYGKAGTTTERVVGEAPTNGTPILSAPIVLRVWVAPWEDESQVLHDQAFLYAVADPGHWQVAHSKRQIANEYRVLEPVVKQSAETQPIEKSPVQPFQQPQQPQSVN